MTQIPVSSSTGDLVKYVHKSGRQKTPFLSYVNHPLREEMDRMLFEDHMPVKHVHAWLELEHMTDPNLTKVEIPSYILIWRYFKRRNVSVMDQVVQENAQETIERNWDAASAIIRAGLQAIKNGQMPTAKEVVAAMKIQNDLIERHGGIPGKSEILKDAQRRLNLLVDIVLDVIGENEDMKQQIADKIADTPDLYEWITPE